MSRHAPSPSYTPVPTPPPAARWYRPGSSPPPRRAPPLSTWRPPWRGLCRRIATAAAERTRAPLALELGWTRPKGWGGPLDGVGGGLTRRVEKRRKGARLGRGEGEAASSALGLPPRARLRSDVLLGLRFRLPGPFLAAGLGEGERSGFGVGLEPASPWASLPFAVSLGPGRLWALERLSRRPLGLLSLGCCGVSFPPCSGFRRCLRSRGHERGC